MMEYCPKCKSLLYPIDEKYIEEHGVCSYCITYNHRLERDDFKWLRKRSIMKGGSK